MEDTKATELLKPLPKKANGFKRFVQRFTIILLLVLLLFGYWKYYYTYSDGNRSGLLQKFSHKGNVFKTYEGELVLNSLVVNGTSPIGSEKFFFSVDDEALGKKMQELEGQKVVVHYQQKNGTLVWRGETEYIVDSVRVVGP